jgi:DNA modification methylase
MKTQIVNFHNDQLIAIEKDDMHYVAMKPIAESLGLQWQSQFNRIKRDSVLSEGVFIMDIPSNGGKQSTTMLPIEYLNGWLFGIDDKRIKCETKRNKIIQYKKECYRVLFEHFNTVDNRFVTPAMKAHMHVLVKQHAHKTGRTYQSIWSEANRYCGASKIDEILKENYPAFCQFFHAEPVEGEYIPKQTNLLIPYKDEIEKEIADFPNELTISHVYEGHTRTNRIFKALEKQGVNVDDAKKENRIIANQLHQLQHANDTLVEQMISFKKHCRQMITNFKYFDSQFQLFDHKTDISTKWCSRNLPDSWLVC